MIDKSLQVDQLFFQTREFFLLYKAICKSAGLNRPTRIPKPWIPPYAGWLKANLDGAFDRSSNTGGVGVIVHDSQGVILGGDVESVPNLRMLGLLNLLSLKGILKGIVPS